jgi:hypothetical protein
MTFASVPLNPDQQQHVEFSGAQIQRHRHKVIVPLQQLEPREI